MYIILLTEKSHCSCIFLEFPALGITPLKFWNLRGGDWEHGIPMRLEVMAFPGDEGDCDFQISCPAWGMLDMLNCAFQIAAKFTDPRLFASFIFPLILKEVPAAGAPTLSLGNQQAPARAELWETWYGPCVAWVARSTTGWDGDMRRETGRQRGDGLCCRSSNGPVAQLERACRLPSLAPVHRARQPLPLVACCISSVSTASSGPASPMLQLHLLSHLSSVSMKKQTGRRLPWLAWEKSAFHSRERWSFEKAGNSFSILPNVLLDFSCGCTASLTLGHSGPLSNRWWVCD